MKPLAALSLLLPLLPLAGCGRGEPAASAPAPKPMTSESNQSAVKRFTRDEAPNEPHTP